MGAHLRVQAPCELVIVSLSVVQLREGDRTWEGSMERKQASR